MTTKQIEYNAWSHDLYVPHSESPYDYMLVDGGRGASKTHEVTQALAVKGHHQPLRICIAREHLKSITGIRQAGTRRAHAHAGPAALRIATIVTKDRLLTTPTATHVFFIGLSTLSEEDIKGLAMVDICWIEEAHRMSPRVMEPAGPYDPQRRRTDMGHLEQQDTASDAIATVHRGTAVTTRWCGTATSPTGITLISRSGTNANASGDKEIYPDLYAHGVGGPI